LQLCSSAALQLCSFAALQLCSFAALQLCSFAALQLCSSAALKMQDWVWWRRRFRLRRMDNGGIRSKMERRLKEGETEAAEALWFEKNQDQLLKLFEEAGRKGTLRTGGKSIGITVSKSTGGIAKPPSQKVMLRIPADDLVRARHLAERKGLPYQTYMKLLLREGLDRAEKTRRRA
jgi:hypothetical protein